MLIRSAELWLAATNCYVVAPAPGGPAVVVDAPPDLEGVTALLAKSDLTPVALLVTHGHIDHTGGARAITGKFSVSAYLHPDDMFLAADPGAQLRALLGGLGPAEESAFAPPEHFEDLRDGERLDLAGLEFEVLHTPGHTPGHCCFHIATEGVLFSGDQLFAGSIGRTDLPGGDFATLMRSMRDRVLPLADDTAVLPGHGPETTVGRERSSNPFIQEMLDG